MARFARVVCAAALCFSALAGCIQLEDFYSFGAAAGDSELDRGDDEHSEPLQLSRAFPYYDQQESQLYINTNGILSFGAPSSEFSSSSFPLNSRDARRGLTFNVIAPFWGDVDTTVEGSGRIWFRQTSSIEQLSQAKESILAHSLLYLDTDLSNFHPSLMVVVTWDHVGYYRSRFDKTNTFQCVLVTDGNVSFALFLYAEGEIEWISGDSSGGVDGLGGTSAQLGFNAGDGIRHYSLPLSQTNELSDIDKLPGNTRVKGLWIFRVDQKEIKSGQCSNDGSIRIHPNSGNVLGGTVVVVTGPCFDDFKKVNCSFESSLENVSPEAVQIDQRRILCVVPQLRYVGRSSFKLLLIDDNNVTIESQKSDFFSLASFNAYKVNYQQENLLLQADTEVALSWTPRDVFIPEEQDAYTIDVVLFGLVTEENTALWMEIAQVATNESNSGSLNITVPDLPIVQNHSAYLTIAFQVRFSSLSIANQSYDQLSIPAGIWTKAAYYNYECFPSRDRCVAWAGHLKGREAEMRQINDLPPCPCNVEQADAPNSGYWQQQRNEFFNSQADVCYYQLPPLKIGSARQCCYGNMGELLDGTRGGGTSDFLSPFSDANSPHLVQLLHFESDVIPFLDCCKTQESLCLEYHKFRPSTMGSCEHNKPIPAFIYGDPHFITLDGHRYTFNGKGEFTLVETDDSSFTLQGRTKQATGSVGRPSVDATVLSVLVARQLDSDTVQLGTSRSGIDIFVNGKVTELNIGSQLPAWNVIVSRPSELKYSMRFSSGVVIEMQRELDYLSVIVSLPESFMNHTRGLLGNYNGDTFDDLQPAGSQELYPLDSNLLTIHEGFGLSWLVVSPESSLFTYEPHEDYYDFFLPWFTPSFFPQFASEELRQEATDLCDGDEFCLYDVMVTGQLEVGNLTKASSQRWLELVELSEQIECSPPCQNGTCVRNNTCSCHTGYSGETCGNKSLVDGCIDNPCLNGGTCKKLGTDSVCLCPPFASGLNCERNTPFSYNCTSLIDQGQLIVRCTGNKPVTMTVCHFDHRPPKPCSLPLHVELATEGIRPGNHILRITATDVTDLSETAVLMFSKEPLKLMLINSSPRVWGGAVDADFSVNRKRGFFNVTCQLLGQEETDCTNGYARYDSVPEGRYVLKLTAKSKDGERDIVRRKIFVGYEDDYCAVHLINEGVEVEGQSVKVQFHGTRSTVSHYLCKLDNEPFIRCRSPYTFVNLKHGEHRIKIAPICKSPDHHPYRTTTKFLVE